MLTYSFESLEQRLLLAASLNLKKNGTLLIRGDNSDDVLEVTGTGAVGEIRIGIDTNGDGTVDDFQEFTGVKNITIRGAGGDDTVKVEGISIDGHLKLMGGKGDDFVSITDSTINGRTIIQGQQGNDTFVDLGGNAFGNAPKIRVEVTGDSADSDPFAPKPPTPVDDYYETADNLPLTHSVLLNDYGTDLLFLISFGGGTDFITSISSGDQIDSLPELEDGEIAFSITTTAGGALLVQQQSGMFVYTPPPVPDGTTIIDTFTYTVTNLNGETASANVYIRVHGDAAPTAGDDIGIADLEFNESGANQVSSYNLLSNDNGANRVVLFSAGTFDDNALALAGQILPVYASDVTNASGLSEDDLIGLVSISSTGELTFTADAGLAAKLGAGEYVFAELSYMIDPGFAPVYTFFSGPPALFSFADVVIRVNGE